jgi:Aspartyl/Asparaginyl beta-hydroxylase
MMPIRLLKTGFDVDQALAEIEAHPEFWNLIPFRREKYGTPHNGVDDIWVRYNAWRNFDGDHQKFNSEHDSEWYPAAYELPAVMDLVFEVMSLVRGERLGAVLITRIPPGGMVAPHIDGGWHAGYYRKFAIQLMGNHDQAFCYDGWELRTNPGDLFTFHNNVSHWVTNESNIHRMTLIICIRGDIDEYPL